MMTIDKSDLPVMPPGFELVTLREAQDAHKEAVRQHERGAGTLFWVRRFDVAEFALILEPEEPLVSARRAFYIGMNALADTLATHAPPDKSVSINYPDALLLDNALIGGGRLAWDINQNDENKPPAWLVFSGMIRTHIVGVNELGLVAGSTSLEDEGGEVTDAQSLITAFTRHFMSGVHDYLNEGMKPIASTYLARLNRENKDLLGIDGNGDLITTKKQRTSLQEALKPIAWFDKTSGSPKL